jgi:hypothetical protein
MTKEMQRVELQVDANLVAPGDVVLRANLSDLELEELRTQGGRIEYWGDDKDPIKPDSPDPRSATWTVTVPQNRYLDEHKATVKIIGKDKSGDMEIASGEAAIYVISDTGLALTLDPTDVQEGTPIRLYLSRVKSGKTIALSDNEAAALKKADLRIEWLTNRGTVELTDSLAKAVWHTAGMAGTNSVTARLVDRNNQVLKTPKGPVAPIASAYIQPTGLSRGDTLKVALQRSSAARTRDQAFWSLIRSCTNAISGSNYLDFIDNRAAPHMC